MYADQRAKWERLYEATQIKGDGETHPVLSPNDEFANYERWDKGNLDLSVLKNPEMLQFEYARRALMNGLKLEKELGVNPFKFGMIGSTDAHTGLAAVEEDNFFGKTSSSEPSPTRAEHPFVKNPESGVSIMSWETTASGYAAVWATENTREALFDAMERRETYATTGPRMIDQFPYSQPWGRAMGTFFWETANKLFLGFLHALPGLATVVVIFVIARLLTRFIADLFKGIETGRVVVPGVFAETSSATRRMANALVWLFALVVAYPYIPGSQTDAFKGISVFIGLMFTLGSAGVMNHMMSGLVLIYSRALKKGDYVRVGETEGTVMEVGPLSTKIMTRRKEEVTIPNTVMTGSTVTNYSRLSKENGIVLTTKVTIGYDAPWRQVHALLSMAADRTPQLRKTPKPFVMQTALDDFYVEYTLSAYLDRSFYNRIVRVEDRQPCSCGKSSSRYDYG